MLKNVNMKKIWGQLKKRRYGEITQSVAVALKHD